MGATDESRKLEMRAAAMEEATRVVVECAWAIDAGAISPGEAIERITEAFGLYMATET